MYRIFLLVMVSTCLFLGGCDDSQQNSHSSSSQELNSVTDVNTIGELMHAMIIPVSDVIWRDELPTSVAEWQALENAANQIVSYSQILTNEGEGKYYTDPASAKNWQNITEKMRLAALETALAAKRMESGSLLPASELLYQQCEACHTQFHPGVVGTRLSLVTNAE